MLTLDTVLIAEPPIGATLDFENMFGRVAPVELEIGCGKGAYLLRQAKGHPERDFLGIEWANKICRYAADRMARWGVGNVRLMRTDAKVLVMRHLAPGCLAAMHIFHPDPWPKKRHHKRRLIQADFMEAAVRALKAGARLAIQTDHAEYFEQIRAVTGARADLTPVAFEDPEYGTGEARAETNYEVKYLKEGRAIYRVAFRRA